MAWAAIAIGGNIVGGLLGASSAKKAAKAQTQASREAMQMQERMFNQQTALQEPFRQAGLTGQNEYMRLLGLGGDPASQGYGSLQSGFMPQNYMEQIDPGYGFRMSEGLKALQKSAAARGGFLSGKTLKDITGYGQEMASQEYQNAFNRYQTARNATLDPYGRLAGMGQQTATGLGEAATNYGSRQSDLLTGMGNARASGYVGATNALTNAFSNAVNTAGQFQYLDYLKRNPSGGVGVAPPPKTFLGPPGD
jgi:hypothetical protein